MKILVLFDIDGTILRLKDGISRKLFKNLLSKIFDKEIEDAHLPSFAGMTDLQIIREIAVNSGIDYNNFDGKFTKIWEDLYIDFTEHCTFENIILMPGINELLPVLHSHENISLGILTGNFRQNAYLKLGLCDLDRYFPFGAFGCDNEDRNLLPPIAIKRANDFHNEEVFTNSNTMIIGDAPRDIECAKSNGIPVISVATGGFSQDELLQFNPDYLFENLTDTEQILKTILGHF